MTCKSVDGNQILFATEGGLHFLITVDGDDSFDAEVEMAQALQVRIDAFPELLAALEVIARPDVYVTGWDSGDEYEEWYKSARALIARARGA